MKNFVKLIVAAVLASVLAFAASAIATIDYDLVPIDASAGTYKMVATITNKGGFFSSFKSDVTIDTSVLVPVSKTKFTAAPITTNNMVKTPIKEMSYYDEDNEEDITAAHTPASPTWTVSGTFAKLVVEEYVTVKTVPADKLVAYEIYFKLADGKTLSDLKNDTFVIDYVKYADHTTKEETYNHTTNPNTLTVNNNVIPPEPTDLFVKVTAGDIIYFQDDTVATAETTGDYKLPTTENGYVVVNSGFTAQKLYKVESGAITEVTSNENGVLATDSASLRKDSVATGLRFKSSFATALKNTVKEYGYLVTVESAYNALPAGYVLNMDLVNAGKAKKGIAFNKADGTDIYFNVDGARTIVTAVATNIPLTKDAVTTNIVARPYYELEDGTIVYGETVKRQAAEVAQKIKAEDAETYAKYKDYIDAIVALVAEDPTYAIIDLGPLFS